MIVMRFRVGSWNVPVVLTPQRPIDRRRRACDGLIDFEEASIRLWAGLRGRRLTQVLWHELWHLKRHHLGVTEDMELDCKLASAFIEDIQEQLQRQGGAAHLDTLARQLAGDEPPAALVVDRRSVTAGYAVRELKLVGIGDEFPDADGADVSDAFDEDGRDRPEQRLGGGVTADCVDRACGRSFYGSDVLTGDAYWCDQVGGRVVGGRVVKRELHCPSCGQLQVWVEGFDPVRGVPNGVAVAVLERTSDPARVHDFQRRLDVQRRKALGLVGGEAG